jgi:hypothetical protein
MVYLGLSSMNSFDFDVWAQLAISAPEKFERQRRNFVKNQICRSPNAHRMRGLQCGIDMERIRARTPLKACLRISTLMWDVFINLNNAMNTAMGRYCESTCAASHSTKNAKIICFPAGYKPRK